MNSAPRIEEKPLVTDCPKFKFTDSENCHLLYRMCIWATDWLEVVGDPDNGGYEWIWRDESGKILKYSDAGYGMTAAAMRDGLTVALGDEFAPAERSRLMNALHYLAKECDLKANGFCDAFPDLKLA